MEAINLNQIPTEYIMTTKAGNLWRCGRGYRKNWTKLIGKLVLIHNTPYTLINRIKEAGKWYLVFTDGQNNYTERQDKALHNKKLAKDTIIEAAKRVIAGLLPAPKELIDRLVEQVEHLAKQYNEQLLSNPANYTTRGRLKSSVKNDMLFMYKEYNSTEKNFTYFKKRVSYISIILKLATQVYNYIDLHYSKKIFRQLRTYYHPDRTHSNDYNNFYYINKKFEWIK